MPDIETNDDDVKEFNLRKATIKRPISGGEVHLPFPPKHAPPKPRKEILAEKKAIADLEGPENLHFFAIRLFLSFLHVFTLLTIGI